MWIVQANIIVQICDEKKSKPVGIAKINLGTFIEEQTSNPDAPLLVKTFPLEKCPDKQASVEFQLRTTLVNANVTNADNLSQMSDVMSNIGDDVESQFDFEDFLEDDKNDAKSTIARIRSKIHGGGSVKRPAATILKTHIMQGSDPTRPPLMIGKQVPVGPVGNSDLGGIDADSIILNSVGKPSDATANESTSL